MRLASLALLAAIFSAQAVYAHFGMIVPDHSMVFNKAEANLKLNIAFSHPFANKGMAMQPPLEIFAFYDGVKRPLPAVAAKWLGEPAFMATCQLDKPGVYQFAVIPRPYYEKAEDSFIIHYAKTIVGAFGNEEDWQKPVGLPMEIVPLTRPFGNYSGNCFAGKVLKDGKPLANAFVEVEFLNANNEYKAPNPYFETQVVLTDSEGVFTFGIPWPGWWGFAALAESSEKLSYQGEEKNVELGGVIWLEFLPPIKAD